VTTEPTSADANWREYGPFESPRILDAALQAFHEHGYHGTTTRDLARRAGLSVPGVYHYYPSKQDILVDLMMVVIDELLTRSRQALQSASHDARSQFDALVESLLRFHMYRRTGAMVSTAELRSLEPGNRERYVAKRDEQQRMLDRVILEGVRNGEFSTPYPEHASRAIVSLCVGVASWYRPDGTLPVEALLDRYLTIARSIVGIGEGSSGEAASTTTATKPSAGRSTATHHEPARSAIVTGASRGIGRGIALALAARGWRLTLAARDPNRLAAVAAEAEAAGASHVDYIDVDLATPDGPAAVVAAHAARHDCLDALVLSAGVGSAAPLDGYPVSRYEKQFALNTRAPFLLISQALPLLRAAAQRRPASGARVIALASIGGVYAEPSLAVYGAAKAALLALCRGLNAEESAGGVTATAIAPGYVDTDMSAWVHDAVPPESMIPVDDVVATVTGLLDLSPRSVINEIVLSRAGTTGYQA